ncbi:hypothetical protein SprV_0100278100 [Sparganum proliferum]
MEHKRAFRGGDPLSQFSTHILEEGHEFSFASTRIMAQASNETKQELLKAGVSCTKSINRHVGIPLLLPRASFLGPRGADQLPAKDARRHDALRRFGLSLIANTTPSSSSSSSTLPASSLFDNKN